mmetsp:Transcript_65173/g.146988  ORF Transcript_65173/g.146988 Transcript_65173/m.146988 type:complete len:290 (+) Transcript_65173:1513-2382(+)
MYATSLLSVSRFCACSEKFCATSSWKATTVASTVSIRWFCSAMFSVTSSRNSVISWASALHPLRALSAFSLASRTASAASARTNSMRCLSLTFCALSWSHLFSRLSRRRFTVSFLGILLVVMSIPRTSPSMCFKARCRWPRKIRWTCSAAALSSASPGGYWSAKGTRAAGISVGNEADSPDSPPSFTPASVDPTAAAGSGLDSGLGAGLFLFWSPFGEPFGFEASGAASSGAASSSAPSSQRSSRFERYSGGLFLRGRRWSSPSHCDPMSWAGAWCCKISPWKGLLMRG